MRHTAIAIVTTACVFTFYCAGAFPQGLQILDVAFQNVQNAFFIAGNNMATALLHRPVTVSDLQDKYNSPASRKVRILVVPGHEPGFGGTEYGNLKEREMNVELATQLYGFLKNNGHYDVMLARDDNAWNPVLLSYFQSQWNEIAAFFHDNKTEMLHLVNTGKVNLSAGKSNSNTGSSDNPIAGSGRVYHNAAPKDVALRLYGINKWENENSIDIAIHVHFNDNPRKNTGVPGQYSGFAMYVPEPEYANSTTTRAIAETVFKRLSKYNAVSNLPNEDAGIIDEPELIAIGAYNTTNSASMLVEYGYIYEPQFQTDTVRHSTIKDLAFQTYLGIQDFFGSGNDVSFAYDTLMLPHSWKNSVTAANGNSEDVLALQSALLLDGVYPGSGKTKNDCPRTGKIGPCTLDAIDAFQKKYNIKGEEGVIGPKTRSLLNDRYSIQSF